LICIIKGQILGFFFSKKAVEAYIDESVVETVENKEIVKKDKQFLEL